MLLKKMGGVVGTNKNVGLVVVENKDNEWKLDDNELLGLGRLFAWCREGEGGVGGGRVMSALLCLWFLVRGWLLVDR